MNPLLDSFMRFIASQPGSAQFFEAFDDLRQKFFSTVKAKSPRYFELNGFKEEEDFDSAFYLQFLEQKLLNEHVQRFLANSPNDGVLKRNLYSLIRQYYNTAFVDPSVKTAKTALDTIIAKMKDLDLVQTDSRDGTRNTTVVTRLTHLYFEEIIEKMTAQFRNNPDKYASLYKVVEHLNNNGETRYYNLIDLIKDAPIDQPEPGNGTGGDGNEDGNEAGGFSFGITDEPVDEDTIDGPENILGHHPEKTKINNSYLAGITPVAIESVHSVSMDAEKLFSELMKEAKNIPQREKFLISLILKEAGLKKVEAFMFTWLLRGDLTGPIPIGVRKQVYDLLDIRSSAYYERYDGFQRALKSIMRIEKHSFEYSEIVSAMVIFYKVYKRICVI